VWKFCREITDLGHALEKEAFGKSLSHYNNKNADILSHVTRDRSQRIEAKIDTRIFYLVSIC
jgi:hypothetical protein